MEWDKDKKKLYKCNNFICDWEKLDRFDWIVLLKGN